MKNIILKCIWFSVPIIIGLICIEFILREIPSSYSYKANYLSEKGDNIQTLILGNSHTFLGIKPNMIDKKTFNAAHVSQSLDIDFAILEKNYQKMPNLKNVIISYDYMSLYHTLSKGTENWRIKNYNIYYGLNLGLSATSYFEILNGKFVDKLKESWQFIKGNNNEITCDSLGWGTVAKGTKSLEETANVTILKQAKKRLDAIDEIEKNKKTLFKIIEFAKKKNLQLIFVNVPISELYYKKLNLNQYNETIHFLKKWVSQKDVFFYDFIQNNRFKESDFFDADHLNDKGASKFTKMLKERLIKDKHLK